LAVEHVHTYLVHPGRGQQTPPRIGGTTVRLDGGRLCTLLENIYGRSDIECDIDISFNHDSAGKQQNPCRDLLIKYLTHPTLPSGRLIAKRLQDKTDHRSGLGLLFLITGTEGRSHKIVISRFPTDIAILAEEGGQSLTVQFLERVFMKSATSYKAVMYEDTSLQAGFWFGKAVDRQIIRQRAIESAEYWIFDFLASSFRTTAAAGTRRLAVALRNAAKKADLSAKREIVAAVTLAAGLKGRTTSMRAFQDQFHLSPAAKEIIESQVAPNLLNEHFRFDLDEFSSQVGYRTPCQLP